MTDDELDTDGCSMIFTILPLSHRCDARLAGCLWKINRPYSVGDIGSKYIVLQVRSQGKNQKKF